MLQYPALSFELRWLEGRGKLGFWVGEEKVGWLGRFLAGCQQ